MKDRPVKTMPYSEKHRRALDALEHDHRYMTAFVEKHLGEAACFDYRRMFQLCVHPVPEGESAEVRYEAAFSNWMRECAATYAFIRDRMGEAGIERMAEASVEALKREDSRTSLAALRAVRAVSPGLAFKMFAKTMAYEFQWLTPYSVDELSRKRGVFSVGRCKILEYPDSEETCRVACQGEYPVWLAGQYKVKMEHARQGSACRVTLSPLR